MHLLEDRNFQNSLQVNNDIKINGQCNSVDRNNY